MSAELNPQATRILLVDDDTIFCHVISGALRRRGFEVHAAHNADQVLAMARHIRPTHVVLDLRLGRASGQQLIEPLLAIDETMRIIVLTGYGNIPSAVAAIRAGAINYLTKPVDVDTLLASLNVHVEPEHHTLDTRPMSLRRLEWEHIQRVLAENDGNISATARSLGMHRRTLQRKLQKRPVRS